MRIVIKLGTSTLTHEGGRVNLKRISRLCRVISDIKNEGHMPILVSSGAIGMGVGKLRLPSRPTSLAEKQACAAVGQCELMYIYDREFLEYGHTVAQILLTAPDLFSDTRREKFIATVTRLLEYGVIPIINENDTVATDEIVFGDNDTLAARVAVCCGADILALLSDIDGLFDSDPRANPNAKLISEVWELSKDIMALGEGAGTALGTGGMRTKLLAAQIATEGGCDMIIANGNDPELLYKIADGEAVGTRFYHRR
ncbi:MAG: glutamate 5-kinase [Clostridia bacterium]|nr:glutamate 5-kinase [Clostridia bacterium]